MLKTLGAQVKQYRWVTFITPVFSALEAVADMFLPMLMSQIIDKGVKVGGQAGMQAVLHYGAIMVAVAIGALVCGILAGRFASIASTGFAANLRQAMFANIQSFSFSNIDRFSTAGLVTRLTTDVSNVQLSYQMITRICVRAPVMLITALIMAFSIHASLSMIFVVAIVILAAALSFIIFKATGTFNRVFKKYDDLNASVQENVGAIRVVKAFVREDYERSKFNKAANAVYRMFVKAETYVSFNNPVMMLTVFGSMLGLRARRLHGGRPDEPVQLCHEHPHEPDDDLHDLCHDEHERGQRPPHLRGAERKGRPHQPGAGAHGRSGRQRGF